MAFLVAPIKTDNRNSDPVKTARAKAKVEEKLQVQQQAAQPAASPAAPAAQQTPKGLAAGMLFQDRLTQNRANDSLAEVRKPAAQKLKEAQTVYDAYVQSDEYKQNLSAADQKARMDRWMTAAITGSSDTIIQPIKDKKEQELRAMVDHYTVEAQKELTDTNMRELEGWSDADRAALETYVINRDREDAAKLNPMVDATLGQQAMLESRALIEKYGLEKVDQMAESLKRSKNEETTQQVAQAARDGVNSGTGSAIAHNVASVPAAAVGGLVGLFSYMQGLGRRVPGYETADPNNVGNLLSVYSGAVRGETAGNIEENIGDVGGKIASLGYQGLMSMADSYARMLMGGGSFGGAALAATNTFSQTMSEASAQGATPGQAALLATTKAGIEALSEKIPLDNLLDTAKSGGKGLTDAVIDAFAQAGVEIATEEISLFGSVLADAAIMREKSAYRDMSIQDLLMEAAETAVVAGISGGASSAGASVVGNVMAPAAKPQQNTESAAPVQQEKQQAEPEAAPTPEEVAEQLGKDAPKAEPVQKTEQEITLDQAMRETFGREGNDFGSRAEDLERAQAQEESLRGAAEAYANAGDTRAAAEVEADRQEYGDRVRSVQDQEEARSGSLTDQDAPVSREAPYPGSRNQNSDPLQARSWEEAGSRKTKAYMAENPEVKPFIQQEAQTMAEELANTTKGERGYNEDVHYESGGEKGWWGVRRHTSEDIAELRDSGMSYEQIGKGLNDIIEDHGKENSAAAKRVEMQLNDRLRTGHKDFMTGKWVSPNQAYIDTVNETEANREGREAFDALVKDADNYTHPAQDAEAGAQRVDRQSVSLQQEQYNVIRKDMDEESRYRILSKKNVHVVEDTGSASYGEDIRNIEALPAKAKSKVEKIIRPLAEKLGIINRNLQSPEVSIDFQLSKGKGLKESLSKQLRYGGSYGDFAKALTNLDEILQNAILIEKHGDKYKGTVREDTRLESVSVLFGAFRDGDSIIPVQMEIKKTSHAGGQLYVTVAMTKVEAGVLGSMLDNGQGSSLIPASEYSLPEIFSKINPVDKHFLKYVPDGFLSQEQLSAKKSALQEDADRIAGYPRREGFGVRGTGAAEQNFAGTAAYEDLLSDDNVQRERKGAARSDKVPKYDAKGRPVSEFAGNSMTSRITPDSFTTTIKQMVADGWASHDIRSNDQSLREAAQAITDSGSVYDCLQEIREVAKQGRTSVQDVAKAELIYNHLVNQDSEEAQRMAADAWVTLSQLATNSGRATQIFSVFQRMTPDSQCMVLEREVKLFAEKMKGKGHVPKGYVSSVDPGLLQDYRKAAQEYQKAKTEDAKQEAMEQMSFIQDAVYQAEAAKLPATFKAKWDAWRYMCMLGNVKTQVRNIAGNAAFRPYKDVKDAIGAGLERLAGLDKSQRTKSVLNIANEGDRQLLSWAKADAKSDTVQNALKYSAKLGDDVTSSKMEEKVQVFDTKALETVRKFVEKVPARADLLFKNGHYERSLAGFLKARGYSAADLQQGKVNEAVLNEARSYAIDEAMKATFNDCNAFSDFFSSIGRNSAKKDNPFVKAFNIAAEGVLPFRRTPANIVVRFTEYSPIGLTKGVWDAATKIQNGEISAAAAIDQMAAGVTGTAAMALGFFLAKGIAGFKLKGSGVDEDEERQGHQAYSVEFSIDGREYSYRIDWAAPANLPLFVGANLYELMTGGGEGDMEVSKLTSFLYSLGTMFEPMLSLSCLSSLNDLFEAGKYSDGNALYSVAAQMATSYITQGVPALARQAVQAASKNQQTTFANAADPLVRDLQRMGAQTGVLPWLKTDAVNQWGETESQGGGLLRAFNAFVNPGTLKEIDNSQLEQEVTRLNESQPDSVSPPDTPKTISYTDTNGERHTGHRLTEQEYNTLATVQGQTAKGILDNILKSDTYAAMTDQQKASVFEYVYDYSREKGRTAALAGYDGLDGWMQGIEGNEVDAILDKAVKNAFTDAFEQLTKDPEGAAAALDQAYSLVDQHGITEWAKEAGGRTKYFIDAKRRGVDSQTFAGLYQQFREIDQNPDHNTSDKAAEWSYQLEKAQEAGTITRQQKDALKDSMVYYQMFPAETVKFDQMTEAGISADKAFKIGDLLDGIKPQEGYTNVRDVQKAAALAGSSLSRSEKTAAMKIYLSDAQDENLDLMLGLGYGPEDYAAAYEIYSGESGRGKKNRTINKLREEFGVDYSTAKQIYEIYG